MGVAERAVFFPWARAWAWTLVVVATVGCSGAEQRITHVHVHASFSPAPALDQLRFSVSDGANLVFSPSLRPDPAAAPLASPEAVAILLPDSVAGHFLVVRVDGLTHGSPVATGETNATPVLGGSVDVPVTLAAIPVPTSIDIAPSSLSLPAGDSMPLVVTAHYSNGKTANAGADVSWSTSDFTVATVDGGGAHAKKPGQATLTASLAGVQGMATITVGNAVLKMIEVTAASATLHPLQMQSYAALGHYSDGGTRDLTSQATWTSSMKAVASVSDSASTKGQVTAITPGTTSIAAHFTIDGSAPLTVN